MDGISAVTARITEIRALLHPTPPAATRPAAAPASSAAAASSTALSSAALPSAGLAPTAPSWGGLPSPAAGGAATGPRAPSFADALARAVAPSGGAAAPSVAQLQATYRNGRIPAEALAPIGSGGHRLAAPAAAAFVELQAAARRDGVTFGVTDSYRSYDQQVDVARRKGLYSQGGLAAQPGTSQHGWGLAVDLDLDPRAQSWMRTHGARFGFVEDTPREPWHWAFQA